MDIFKARDDVVRHRGYSFHSAEPCPPELRQAVEAYAAGLSGSATTMPEIPTNLVDYVRKVTLYAYKTTDEDVLALREAGYSEDQIFEITLCASMGAGLGRFERGLSALKGGR